MKYRDNHIYEGRKIRDYKELVSIYKNEHKEHIAFEYKESPSSTEIRKITYSKFAEDIENMGAKLLHMGIERACLISPNKYEWYVSYLAVTTAGKIIAPLDKSLPRDEIVNSIERSDCDAVIYTKKYQEAIDICKKNNPKLVTICFENDFENILKEGEALDKTEYNNVKIDNKKMTIMLFTSGTTSMSKIVMLSQYAICMDMYETSTMTKFGYDDVFLSFLPLHHTFESTTTFLFGTMSGLTIALCDGLKYIQKNMVEYQVTGFVCVPLMLEIMYKKIIKNIEKQGKSKIVKILRTLFRHTSIETRRKIFKDVIDGLGGRLRTIVVGGAAMDKETERGYNDFGIDVLVGYGLTETSPIIAAENSYSKKVGSVGLPMVDADIKIDNPDKNGDGEIIVKTPTIMLGYYKNEEATKEAIVNGYFHTGDVGHIDKDGFLFITGRKKDMIVLKNGKKIFPEELESLINQLPYVSESMVFGKVENTKNDRNSDVVLWAKVVYDKEKINAFEKDENKYYDLILEDIKTKINKQMPAYKYIRDIIITDSPLIKTTTLKIKRHEEMKLINKAWQINKKGVKYNYFTS